ncbi:16 kDa calcium-binding protein [Fasciola hepatica]|uniref:16 kDa calcium-binding protein n=1 Tax=Fasciola hepatica TaxID=6192 RepID=A0A4E0RWG4_FASHE|nr:16 kDa calcium-binding protein [Fasciola hepatica]
MTRVSPDELMKIFETLDTDGSNVVSRRELEKGLSAAGVNSANVERLMNELDLNQDGNITFNEYKLALGLTDEPIAQWKQLFYSLDQDRTGTINRDELKKMFTEMDIGISSSIIDEWIADHDVNGDGRLSYEEFLGFVAEQSGH